MESENRLTDIATETQCARSGRTLLSVIVPAYNEEAVLREFHTRLSVVLDDLDCDAEILYIDDGSSDATSVEVEALRTNDPRVGLLALSRNFGKELAMTAGLDHASGDAVVVIDADLQDPPEVIPDLLARWRAGYDVVYAQRESRSGETWLKRATAHAFYRVMQRLSRVAIPPDAGDFRLLSRRAVDALSGLREHHRFMKGLFAWIGYPQTAVYYQRAPRAAGTTKWNYWRLWNFALEGVTSFTTLPLQVATYIGLVTALGAFLYGLYIIVNTLLYGNPVAGYPSLITVVLFLGGIQLMTLGVIGEYLGRTFNETKRRPLYFIKAHLSPATNAIRTRQKAPSGTKDRSPNRSPTQVEKL